MTGRPEDGYRVAARIESRSSRRGRALAVLAAAVVVGWGAVVVGSRLGDPKATASSGAQSGDVAIGSHPPVVVGGAPGPTYPPNVEIREGVAIGRMPIVLGSLAWLDPLQGTIQRAHP